MLFYGQGCDLPLWRTPNLGILLSAAESKKESVTIYGDAVYTREFSEEKPIAIRLTGVKYQNLSYNFQS